MERTSQKWGESELRRSQSNTEQRREEGNQTGGGGERSAETPRADDGSLEKNQHAEATI